MRPSPDVVRRGVGEVSHRRVGRGGDGGGEDEPGRHQAQEEGSSRKDTDPAGRQRREDSLLRISLSVPPATVSEAEKSDGRPPIARQGAGLGTPFPSELFSERLWRPLRRDRDYDL